MSKMYLLWEWTEEREGKLHYGIYSTLELAKKRADLEALDCGEGPLAWVPIENDWIGEKNDGDDYPYEITEFEVDE